VRLVAYAYLATLGLPPLEYFPSLRDPGPVIFSRLCGYLSHESEKRAFSWKILFPSLLEPNEGTFFSVLLGWETPVYLRVLSSFNIISCFAPRRSSLLPPLSGAGSPNWSRDFPSPAPTTHLPSFPLFRANSTSCAWGRNVLFPWTPNLPTGKKDARFS